MMYTLHIHFIAKGGSFLIRIFIDKAQAQYFPSCSTLYNVAARVQLPVHCITFRQKFVLIILLGHSTY